MSHSTHILLSQKKKQKFFPTCCSNTLFYTNGQTLRVNENRLESNSEWQRKSPPDYNLV